MCGSQSRVRPLEAADWRGKEWQAALPPVAEIATEGLGMGRSGRPGPRPSFAPKQRGAGPNLFRSQLGRNSDQAGASCSPTPEAASRNRLYFGLSELLRRPAPATTLPRLP